MLFGALGQFALSQFLNAYQATASQGTYTYTGQAATTTRQLNTTAAKGSYTLTGIAAATTKQHLISAALGSYTLTGYDVDTFKLSDTLIASPAAYTLTGQAVTLNGPIRITAAQGGYTWTGLDAATRKTTNSSAEMGEYETTGNDAGLLYYSLREDIDVAAAITIPGVVNITACSVPGSASVVTN